MSVSLRRFVRAVSWAIVLVALSLAAPPASDAQTDACDVGPDCLNDIEAPYVSISPAGGVRGRSTVTVVVSWSDDTGVRAVDRHIWLNGRKESLSTWTAAGDSLAGTLSKTISLLPGNNALVAHVCDRVPTCADATATIVHEPSYGVEVTPDAVVRPMASGQAGVQAFAIRNTSTETAVYHVAVACSGAVGGCAASTPSVTVLAGATVGVNATFTAGAPGALGTLTFRATDADRPATTGQGSVEIIPAASSGAQVAPGVSVAGANPETTLARDLCVVASAGAGAAMECGDLRLVGPLPGITTMGRSRGATLVYGSQHATPAALVAVHVSLAASARTPDSVTADLRVAGALWTRGRWAGGEWTPGTTRRVLLSHVSPSLSTGAYEYTVEVRNWYGSASQASTATGQLLRVDRRRSPFGRGWWMAGLERLAFVPADTTARLWVGGDGSALLYRRVRSGVYAAPHLDRPDTLRYVAGRYVRELPDGVRVHFDGAGRHDSTSNRLGHVTRFHYTTHATYGERLDSIRVPVPGGAVRSHAFTYDVVSDSLGARYRLTEAASPGASAGTSRRVSLAHAPGGSRVTGMTYPDGSVVGYGYGDAAAPGRISRRTDRRGFATTFAFDGAGKLASVTSVVGGGSPDVVSRYAPAESRGLAVSVDAASLFTQLDGPRSDVADRTRVWTDRLGQPTRTEDPFGGVTRFFRTNGAFPALVTRVVAANGAASTATYDARGNLLASTDSATFRDTLSTRIHATSRYAWHPVWNSAVAMVDPEQNASPQADSVTAGYDAATGNRLWSRDALGRTTTYEYDPVTRLLTGVVSPEGHRTTVGYDGRGNLRWVQSPLGTRTTYHRDSVGRVVRTDSPIEPGKVSVDTTTFDAMDRVLETRSLAPALTYVQERAGDASASTSATLPAAQLVVTHTYDAEGNRLTTTRTGQPMPTGIAALTNAWSYDGLGRVRTETAPDGRVETFAYDEAGNVVRRTTRRGHVIRTEHDAAGRMVRQTVPEVEHGRTREHPVESVTWHFPRYGTDVAGGPLETVNQGLHAAGFDREVREFTYDVMGKLRSATNPWARVTRGWNANGTLAADTLEIASYADGFVAGQHVYALSHTYDLNGRPTTLRHPSSIAPRASGVLKDTERYGYHADGRLASITDVLGNRFGYEYHADGAARALLTPTGYRTEWTYDADGRMRTSVETMPREMEVDGVPSTVLHRDTFWYDLRGKITDAHTRTGRLMNRYSGLGHLVWHRTEEGDWEWGADQSVDLTGHSEEEYTLDALANHQWARSDSKSRQADVARPTTRSYAYQAATGRLASLSGNRDREDMEPFHTAPRFDEAGNTVRGEYLSTSRRRVVTWSFYDAEDRLRIVDRRVCRFSGAGCSAQVGGGEETSTFEEHRYDPLGRRILTRTRQDLDCSASPGCDNTVRRFVWNGDALLYEIRALGHTGAGAGMERDTGLALPADGGRITGRVAYTNGPEIDRPLNFIRMNYSPGWSGPEAIYPHRNWRGQIDRLSFSDGTFRRCVGESWPPPAWGGTLGDCITATPPGNSLSMIYGREQHVPGTWIGGQLDNMRDASGKLFMRNRYYDPLTGQFTQEDPIGLAGGVNAYGFANGDPATYRDPFGLRPCEEIRRDIARRTRSLNRRIRHYLEKVAAGANDSRHMGNISQERTGLARVEAEYTSEGCDNDDDHDRFLPTLSGAEQALRRPLPAPVIPSVRAPRVIGGVCVQVFGCPDGTAVLQVLGRFLSRYLPPPPDPATIPPPPPWIVASPIPIP